MGIFLVWLVLSAFVGLFGAERKIGFAGAFFASLFLSPLIGIIITAVSKSKAEMRYQAEMLRTQQQQAETLKSLEAKQQAADLATTPLASLPIDPQARVNRLRDLRDRGMLTNDQFHEEISKL